MVTNWWNRLGLRVMRLGMRMARVDYVDMQRLYPSGRVSAGMFNR